MKQEDEKHFNGMVAGFIKKMSITKKPSWLTCNQGVLTALKQRFLGPTIVILILHNQK